MAEATLFETKPDNSYHILPNILNFQCLLLGVAFDSTNSSSCFHYFPIPILAHTKGLSLLCFRNVSWDTCVSGPAFVSLVPAAIVVRGMRVSCSHVQGSPTNSHILPLFCPCFAEWCFSYLFGGRGFWNSAIQQAVII